MKVKISPVSDNKDKAKTYSSLMNKYNLAIENEFYFEALLISYAFLEDRLKSYLYYMGLLKSRASFKFDNEDIQNDINMIVLAYPGKKKEKREIDKIDFSQISGKIKVIRSLCLWFNDGCKGLEDSRYLSEIAECLDTQVETDRLLKTLDEINEWCDYRNEVIHAVLNKNLESLYDELSDRVDQGMTCGRMIDKQISAMKRRKNIRKYLGLQD